MISVARTLLNGNFFTQLQKLPPIYLILLSKHKKQELPNKSLRILIEVTSTNEAIKIFIYGFQMVKTSNWY